MDTTEDFSPYRADGKLVSCRLGHTSTSPSLTNPQYGFVCVVTGASQVVGQAIIHELAAHGAASIYGMVPLNAPLATDPPHLT